MTPKIRLYLPNKSNNLEFEQDISLCYSSSYAFMCSINSKLMLTMQYSAVSHIAFSSNIRLKSSVHLFRDLQMTLSHKMVISKELNEY
jgi:hypothetical protein